MASSRGWSNSEKEEIIKRYREGESSPEIAQDFGVSDVAIRNRLDKWGVERRSRKELQELGQLRENDVNDSCFSVIDAPEKAYWLGFINADGCLTTQNRLTVELSVRDRSHLLKLKEALSAENKIYERQNLCSLVITSKRLSDSLKDLGVKPRKSKSSGETVKIPNNLSSHFWRGMIDGDGHFSTSQRTIVLAGNEQSISDFSEWVHTTAPDATTRPYKEVKTWKAHVCGDSATKVARVLYRNSSKDTRLNRKYERAQQYWRPG